VLLGGAGGRAASSGGLNALLSSMDASPPVPPKREEPPPPADRGQQRLVASLQASDGACDGIKLSLEFRTLYSARTGKRVINGTLTVTNTLPYMAAFERAGVRLCSRGDGHIRVMAQCPSNDVPAGGSVACTWRFALPAGAQAADYTGILRWAAWPAVGAEAVGPARAPWSGARPGAAAAGPQPCTHPHRPPLDEPLKRPHPPAPYLPVVAAPSHCP
jgi:hypothetical protein